MSSEPSIFFSDVNERQGSFLRRTFVIGGLTALGGLALFVKLGPRRQPALGAARPGPPRGACGGLAGGWLRAGWLAGVCLVRQLLYSCTLCTMLLLLLVVAVLKLLG